MSASIDNLTLETEDLFDLSCPGCNADLLADETYATFRVCGTCNRHFWISARERIALLEQTGTFAEFEYRESVLDAVDQRERQTVADRVSAQHDRTALSDAVICGVWKSGHRQAVVIALDPVLLGSGLGIVSAGKVGSAFRAATERHMPVILFAAGGSRPQPAGLIGATIGARLQAVVADLHRAAQPFFCVLAHGVGGSLIEGLAADADYTLAEPDVELAAGFRVDLVASRLDQIATVTSLLTMLAGGDELPALLAGDAAVHLAIEPGGSGPALTIDIESNHWAEHSGAIAQRGLTVARHLDLPIVLILTGAQSIPDADARTLRTSLLEHRSPVVVVLSGDCAAAHLTFVLGDSVLVADDVVVELAPGSRYTAMELRQTGIADNADAVDLDGQITVALGRAMRHSPSRRIDLRIEAMARRGAETDATSEAARREMLAMRDVQEHVRKSMEDWRTRFERRELRLPTFQKPDAMRGFRMPTFSIPDMADMRDRWIAARRGDGNDAAPEDITPETGE